MVTEVQAYRNCTEKTAHRLNREGREGRKEHLAERGERASHREKVILWLPGRPRAAQWHN